MRKRRIARPKSTSGWVLGAAGAMAVVGLAVAGVIVCNRPHPVVVAAQGPTAGASSTLFPLPPTPSSVTPAPANTALSNGEESLHQAVEETRAKYGKDAPELLALLNEQAAMQSELLATGTCNGSVAACSALFKGTSEMESAATAIVKKRLPPSSSGLRSKWLARLTIPKGFPVEDDERVQRIFKQFTETENGRAYVDNLLFRCGTYRDRIQEILEHYDLPTDIFAVVLAESACYPQAKSRVGAEGLWQFMPEAAKHYHLHVQDDVDERHSPPKSTEAAIHFLSDLHKMFHSWELVFAAYNMGPYGLLNRMHRAGGKDVGFWDLMNAKLLPKETADYVPTIEAFALILENLDKLTFGSAQMRPPELTGDLGVPPGTPLVLVARAAATSVTKLKGLNLDIKVDTVPNIPGELFPVQVQKDILEQARQRLEALEARPDNKEQCVGADFDWGQQVFTDKMAAACKARGIPVAPAGSAPGMNRPLK